MRKILFLWLVIIAQLQADIEWQAFEADGVTPFSGRELMVGERLVFVCHSTVMIPDDLWSREIDLAGPSRSLGLLSARGPLVFNPRDWQGSHLPAAGSYAQVIERINSQVAGYQVFTDFDPLPGDWFILDYKVRAPGDPNVSCYELNGPQSVLKQRLFLHQVPSRDLNQDNHVDLVDWVIFQENWGCELCQNPDWCSGADFNHDARVDILDLQMLAQYWLYHIVP